MTICKSFRAAVLEEQNKPLVLRTLEVPPSLYCGQVLVRIKYSGICGAQLGEIAGVKGPDKFLPHTLGHEGGGVVVATGPGVRTVKPGDHVVVHWRKGIGIESEAPKYWCPELGRDVGSGWCSTFQELSVVSENRITKIDKEIPLDIAALMGCAVTTGLGVICNELCVKPGQSVVVFGCGGVGLNVIQGAALVNACPILGIDLIEEKLCMAHRAGATQMLYPNETDLITRVLQGKADYAVDTTGNPNVMKQAWNLLKPDGKLCLVAQLPHTKTFALQTLPMHQGRLLVGSDGGGTNPTTDIPRYLHLYKAFRLKLDGLITHRVPLTQINDLLNEIGAGRVGRGIITFDEAQ